MLNLILVILLVAIAVSCLKKRRGPIFQLEIFCFLAVALVDAILVAIWIATVPPEMVAKYENENEIILEQMDNLKKNFLQETRTEEELDLFLENYQGLEQQIEANNESIANLPTESGLKRIEFILFLNLISKA